MNWRIHHKATTGSTNRDALGGTHGDVYTADRQTAGRGRLDHKWLSPPGENLMMSAVLSVEGLSPERAATIPIAVGLAVIEGLSPLVANRKPGGLSLKWPNDVLCGGRKLAGILCERHGDNVIVGIGVNVNQRKFAPEIEKTAVSLVQLGTVPVGGRGTVPVGFVRDRVLEALSGVYGEWKAGGLSPLMDRISAVDWLKGRMVGVLQPDADPEPVSGVCGGIASDGSLLVSGRRIWAGEAHVASVQQGGHLATQANDLV